MGGLIKHVAATERQWTAPILRRENELDFGGYEQGLRMVEDASLEWVIAVYDEGCGGHD